MIRFVKVLQATRGWAAPEAADAAARAQTLAEKTNNLAQLVIQMAGGCLSRSPLVLTTRRRARLRIGSLIWPGARAVRLSWVWHMRARSRSATSLPT